MYRMSQPWVSLLQVCTGTLTSTLASFLLLFQMSGPRSTKWTWGGSTHFAPALFAFVSLNQTDLLSFFLFSNIQEMRKLHWDAFLKKHNIKLGFMSAFVEAAAVHALTDQPAVNTGQMAPMHLHPAGNAASRLTLLLPPRSLYLQPSTTPPRRLSPETTWTSVLPWQLTRFDFHWFKFRCAFKTPNSLETFLQGLVVPVIRNAETMTFAQIEKTINVLGEKVRSLSPWWQRSPN